MVQKSSDAELHISNLVDQVEAKLLNYISKADLHIGSALPSEQILMEQLGVGRSALREALSRMKMSGMVEARTRKGMVLKEPNLFGALKGITNPQIMGEKRMFDLLELRVILEKGICGLVVANITDHDMEQLASIIQLEIALKDNEYALSSEYLFHSKLYQITGNESIIQFQELLRPVISFIKTNFAAYIRPVNLQLEQDGLIVTHTDLLRILRDRDVDAYKKAIDKHFLVYDIVLEKLRQNQIKDVE